MTQEQKEQLIQAYTELYESGKAIRGAYWGGDGSSRCIIGLASLLNIKLLGPISWLAFANDTPYTLALRPEISGTPVTPAGFSEVIRLLKEWPVDG